MLLLLCISCSSKQHPSTAMDAEDRSIPLNIPALVDFKKSEALWEHLAEIHQDSYIYEVAYHSWTGFRSNTEITVVHGKVISRRYDETGGHLLEGQEKHSYKETGNAIGSHQLGASASTMEQLYEKCANDYLKVDYEDNNVLFASDINGIMSLCGHSPKFCEDDCFHGIRISSFSWID